MKLQNFFQLAFFALAILLFTGCKDDGPKEDNNTTTPSVYTEATDAATGRAAFRVAEGADGIGATSFTWTKDKVWILDGFVFVNDGQTLTIEAGTVIKGAPGTGESASALIVARGGKVIAEGTAAEPIIFTAEADKLDGSLETANGLWGGVIVLGKATVNTATGDGAIEGIPTSEARGIYGGTNDNDNSGVFRYISNRHGGSNIGANNEINGFTLGAVGAGTTVDYLEIFANQDDGVEWFGGTVNAKHLLVTACGDDSYDYDEGYRGKNQFVIAYQLTNDGDRGGEHDGGTDPEDGLPYALPTFYNATYVGRSESRIITFRDNAGGQYHNSIFVNFGKGIDIEFLGSGESSYKRFEADQLALKNNTFFNIGSRDASDMFTVEVVAGKEPAEAELAAARTAVTASFTANGNTVANLGIIRSNLVPNGNGGTTSTPSDSFFTNASYRGAIAPGATPWYAGWTATEALIR